MLRLLQETRLQCFSLDYTLFYKVNHFTSQIQMHNRRHYVSFVLTRLSYLVLAAYLKDSSHVMNTLSSRLAKLAAVLEGGATVSEQTRREALEMAPLLQQLAVLLGLVSGALSELGHNAPKDSITPEICTAPSTNPEVSTSSIPIQTSVGTGFLTIHTSTIIRDDPAPPPAKKSRLSEIPSRV